MDGDINAFFRAVMPFNLSLLKRPKAVDSSICKLAIKCAASRAKLDASCRNSLHNPRNRENSVLFVGSYSPITASVVCEAISGRLKRIKCP